MIGSPASSRRKTVSASHPYRRYSRATSLSAAHFLLHHTPRWREARGFPARLDMRSATPNIDLAGHVRAGKCGAEERKRTSQANNRTEALKPLDVYASQYCTTELKRLSYLVCRLVH
eukprot:479354-Pyramimonas_sp.AAC.2